MCKRIGDLLPIVWYAILIGINLAAMVLYRTPGRDSTAFKLIWPFANGAAIGAALVVFARAVDDRRNRRRREMVDAMLPKEIHHLGETDDGDQLIAVTLGCGDVRTFTLPADYHPSQDRAELLMRQAVPELYDGSLGVRMDVDA